MNMNSQFVVAPQVLVSHGRRRDRTSSPRERHLLWARQRGMSRAYGRVFSGISSTARRAASLAKCCLNDRWWPEATRDFKPMLDLFGSHPTLAPHMSAA